MSPDSEGNLGKKPERRGLKGRVAEVKAANSYWLSQSGSR